MKSMAKYVLALVLVAVLSGCGDDKGKGGLNNSGVESDGKCSKQLMSDLRSFLDDIQAAGDKNDRPAAKAACGKFNGKYGNVTCTSPETGKKFEGAQFKQMCAQF